MGAYNWVSLGGLFALLGLGWLLSAHRRRLNVRCVLVGVGLQLLLGLAVFRAPGRTRFFGHLNAGVNRVMVAAQRGQEFVFGPLSDPEAMAGAFGPRGGFVLATQALPLIIFFASAMALLYYWGVMQRLIRAFAWVFTRLMRVSGAESLCAASNIFVGVESATTVRPYLAAMTRSELCTVLTAGMATIASTVLFMYARIVGQSLPNIAGHLISASLMSAPAAIVMSKVLLPETDRPETLGRIARAAYEREGSAIEAVIGGATAGTKLLVGIVALLIAFLGLVGVLDLVLAPAGEGCEHVVNRVGGWLGAEWTVDFAWSLERLLGYVMWPFAVIIGVPPEDSLLAGELLGKRLVVTEVVAYQDLAVLMRAGEAAATQPAAAGAHFVHARSPVIVAYALCGFAHVASLAIFVGGVSALVPQRRGDLAAVGPRALLAATLACLMTGAVAGVFFRGGPTVL